MNVVNWLPRTRVQWILLSVGCLLVLVALIAALWLPTVALAALEARLAARGLSIVVADVDVGLNGIALEGPRVRLPGREQPVFEAERIAVGLSWWSLSGGASSALSRLQVANGKVDLDAAALTQLLSRKSKPDAREDKSARALPPIELHQVDVVVRDATGALFELDDLVLELANERFEGTAAKLTVGSLPGDVATAVGLRLAGPVRGRRPALQQASAKSAVLTWADEPLEAAQHARPGIVSRLRSFVAALRSARSSQPSPAPTAAAGAPSAALWTDDAKVLLPDLRILTTRPGAPEQTLLRELKLELLAAGAQGFSAAGQGRSESGGKLAFSLHGGLEPLSLAGDVELDDLSLALFEPALPPLPYKDLAATRVSASLVLDARGLSGVGFRGELSLRDLTFEAAGLARAPVGPMNITVAGQGNFTPLKRELVLEQASVALGEIETKLSGTLAWPSGAYRVQVTAQLPKSPCAKVLGAVPSGLLDELASVELSGDLTAGLEVYVDAGDLDNTKVDFDVRDQCRFESVPELLDLNRFAKPFIHSALEPDGTTFELETGPGTPAWTPIELVSPFLAQAVIAHEDGRFLNHHGFAEPEIAVALARNLKAKAFRFGASTITMQLVKNVFLHRDKLLARKVQEALITWWLEQGWDKRRILELYLNVIEYGPAIYGVRNAAWHYFGTIPMNLTPAQSAFLASILPSPKTFHEQYEKGELSASMKNRLAFLLKHMRSRERIDDEALAFGLAELEGFRFYRPEEPPPVPVEVHGSAAPLPFTGAPLPLDIWDLELPPSAPEDGSYGNP